MAIHQRGKLEIYGRQLLSLWVIGYLNSQQSAPFFSSFFGRQNFGVISISDWLAATAARLLFTLRSFWLMIEPCKWSRIYIKVHLWRWSLWFPFHKVEFKRLIRRWITHFQFDIQQQQKLWSNGWGEIFLKSSGGGRQDHWLMMMRYPDTPLSSPAAG